MQGVSHRHLSDHLSDLIETTLAQLEEAKIIAIDEDTDELEPLNMAMISSYYYIAYTTMRLFNENLTEKTKLRGLFEIICGASEFDDLPVRPGEEESIERLIRHAKLPVSKPDYLSSTTKANALLQVPASSPLGITGYAVHLSTRRSLHPLPNSACISSGAPSWLTPGFLGELVKSCQLALLVGSCKAEVMLAYINQLCLHYIKETQLADVLSAELRLLHLRILASMQCPAGDHLPEGTCRLAFTCVQLCGNSKSPMPLHPVHVDTVVRFVACSNMQFHVRTMMWWWW